MPKAFVNYIGNKMRNSSIHTKLAVRNNGFEKRDAIDIKFEKYRQSQPLYSGLPFVDNDHRDLSICDVCGDSISRVDLEGGSHDK